MFSMTAIDTWQFFIPDWPRCLQLQMMTLSDRTPLF
jgi:hypothetical protein